MPPRSSWSHGSWQGRLPGRATTSGGQRERIPRPVADRGRESERVPTIKGKPNLTAVTLMLPDDRSSVGTEADLGEGTSRPAPYAVEEARADMAVDVAVPPRLSRLKAQGTLIVNQSDETVILEGVNLGGWLLHKT